MVRLKLPNSSPVHRCAVNTTSIESSSLRDPHRPELASIGEDAMGVGLSRASSGPVERGGVNERWAR